MNKNLEKLMENTKNMTTVEQENLEEVVGGNGLSNYGDKSQDNDPNHSMYEVGQTVPVYLFFIHFHTDMITLTDKKFNGKNWLYGYWDNIERCTLYITADSIAR